MARPVEFDRTNGVQSAMLLFWSQGYTVTSLSQLLEAMQIGKSSFYAAFGDKRSLFIETLDLFGDRTREQLLNISRENGCLDSVRLFFETTLFSVQTKRMRQGCMMVNTILELADVDQGLSEHATKKLDQIEKVFERCFTEALESGEIHSSQSPKQIAAFVMTLNQGLRVSSRKYTPKKELASLVDTTLNMLETSLLVTRNTTH